MKKNIQLLCLLLVSTLLALPVRADSLMVVSDADTWIFSELPDNNNGRADTFATGINMHASTMRALIRFDVSSIPTNATVTSASLTMVETKNDHGGDATFVLHRVLNGW